jgi:hypothetical protein
MEYYPTKQAKRNGHVELMCRDSTSLSVHVKMIDANPSKQQALLRKKLSATEEADFMRRRRRHTVEKVHRKPALNERMIYLIKIEELGGQYMKKRIVYMVPILMNIGFSSHLSLYIIFPFQANESFVTIENLTPNQSYNISATVYNSRNEFIHLYSKTAFRTQDIGVTPKKVSEMWLDRLTTSDEKLLNAEISWTPGSGQYLYLF